MGNNRGKSGNDMLIILATIAILASVGVLVLWLLSTEPGCSSAMVLPMVLMLAAAIG